MGTVLLLGAALPWLLRGTFQEFVCPFTYPFIRCAGLVAPLLRAGEDKDK